MTGPTWCSSNGVQNLAVMSFINLAKWNDPVPYLQNKYDASVMFLALKTKSSVFDLEPYRVTYVTLTIQKGTPIALWQSPMPEAGRSHC